MRFVGRESELESLRHAWRAAFGGKQQVVAVVGEPRLGKTRIVQEFYGWLNKHEDFGKCTYWPDTLPEEGDSLGINPIFSEHSKVGAPPWLWWGVRWPKPNEHNSGEVPPCAALSCAHYLLPHLEVVRRLLEKKKADRNAVFEVGKKGLDLATLGTLSPVISVYELCDTWIKARKQGSSISLDVKDHREKHAESKLNRLNELLLAITATDQVIAGGVPLILVLDDVQWADAESLQFIQRLMRELGTRAKQQPHRAFRLLVVATVWEREWNNSKAMPVSSTADSAPQSFSEILRALDHQAQTDGLITPRLFAPVLTELPIGKLDGYLNESVQIELPGLTAAQCALVVQRAGGSPGLLAEILIKLKARRRELFENQDLAGQLTQGGEAAVRVMSVKYHELVEERLTNLDDMEAATLGMASYVGLGYSRPFVQDLASRFSSLATGPLVAQKVEDALRRADEPLAIVQEVAENVDEFRLPVYREVLRRHLQEWDDLRSCVEEHVPDLVCSWMEDAKLNSLPLEEKAAFLAFGSTELQEKLSKGGDERLRASLLKAWTEQIAVLEADGRIELGLAVLDCWLQTWRVGHKGLLLQIRYSRLRSLLRFAFALNNMAAINEIAGYGIDALTAPESAYQSAQLAMLLEFAGRAALHTEHLHESLGFFRRFQDEALSALEAYGVTAERLRDASVSKYRVGDVLLRQDQVQPALASFHDSLEDAERILREFGASAERLRRVYLLKIQVGDVLLRQDQVEPSLALFRESQEIAERVLREYGASAERLRDVYRSKYRVGDVLLHQDKIESALGLFCDMLEIAERILREYGASAERLRRVYVSKVQVADVQLRKNQVQPALALYRESLEIAERILREYGASAERLRDLSLPKAQVGEVLLIHDQDEPALDSFRESLGIAERILREYGASAERLRRVFLLKVRVGDVLMRQKQVEPALTLYRESHEIAERVLQEYGASAERLRDVSLSKVWVGDVLLRKNQIEPALTLYRESQEIAERILREYGASAEQLRDGENGARARRLRDVYVSKVRVGDVLLRQDQVEPALALYRESLEIAERILREYGVSAERLGNLCFSLEKLTTCLAVVSPQKEALVVAKRGLVESMSYASEYPSSDAPHFVKRFESLVSRLGELGGR